jgi:hypothetical protein
MIFFADTAVTPTSTLESEGTSEAFKPGSNMNLLGDSIGSEKDVTRSSQHHEKYYSNIGQRSPLLKVGEWLRDLACSTACSSQAESRERRISIGIVKHVKILNY